MTTASVLTMANEREETIDLNSIKSKFIKFKGGDLKLEKNDDSGIALLCLNSHGRKNAFSGQMMVQFSDILSELEEWKMVRI